MTNEISVVKAQIKKK